MTPIEVEIKQHLNLLIGLPLCIVRRAADMLVLHFGTIREVVTIRKSDGKSVRALSVILRYMSNVLGELKTPIELLQQ